MFWSGFTFILGAIAAVVLFGVIAAVILFGAIAWAIRTGRVKVPEASNAPPTNWDLRR